ncbi:hypothetical protein FOZ60_005995 [Perkinsus olseni]|uniref:Uncharacterized protein n=1 Tax=Perkinsus olseni TaxID=32597 RepID=A0A7J6NQP8_PEROL|nr:hypothetical protein FOZ60_005995 [Perkinsus olseni]
MSESPTVQKRAFIEMLNPANSAQHDNGRTAGDAELSAEARLFTEIFQETGSGDIGLQIRDGPMFRSDFGKLGGLAGRSLALFGSGVSTRSEIAGSAGSVTRPDYFALPERYEVPYGNYEQLAEILRFIYCGSMYYFDEMPHQTEVEKQDKVEAILDSDGVAVANEDEILLLIERWNAQGDKSKEEMARLMRCYRQEPFKSDYNKKCPDHRRIAANSCGPLQVSELRPEWTGTVLSDIEDIGHRKLPRSHRFKEDDMVSLVGERVPSEKEAKEAQEEFVFVLMESNRAIEAGNSLVLRKGQAALQQAPFDGPGSYKIRITLSQFREAVWPSRHKVFFGVNYGATKYFGWIEMALSPISQPGSGVVSKSIAVKPSRLNSGQK